MLCIPASALALSDLDTSFLVQLHGHLKRTVPCDFLEISNGKLNCTGILFEQIPLARIKQLDVVYMEKEYNVSDINESDIKNVNAMSMKKKQAVAEQQRAAQQASRQKVTANTRLDQVSVADILLYTSKETNKNLPLQVDSEKILEMTAATYDTLLCKFRFVDDSIVKQPMFKKEKYLKHVHESLCRSTCTDQSTLSLLQRGAKYNYLFVDRTGVSLFDYTLDASECSQCRKENSAGSSIIKSPFKKEIASNIKYCLSFILAFLVIGTSSGLFAAFYSNGYDTKPSHELSLLQRAVRDGTATFGQRIGQFAITFIGCALSPMHIILIIVLTVLFSMFF
jgi:hypothetical protein